MDIYIWGSILIGCCIGIMKSCDFFEPGADYIGRNMSAGARGALINALGSSMPELLVTLSFVLTGNPNLILAGIAVTAGSAIFNAVLIPAISILFTEGKMELDRKVLMRDGVYLLIIEGILIWMLGQAAFTLPMVISLILSYSIYAYNVIIDSNKNTKEIKEYTGEIKSGKIAWSYLIGSMTFLSFFCHYLAKSIDHIAHIANWPVYIVAVTLGAAATSLPDTILSVKSAKDGEGDDAVGNAIGSNIFDVTGALAIPMLLVMIIMHFNGENMSLPIEQSSGLTGLRYFVWGTSAAVIGILMTFAKGIENNVAGLLLGIYGIWITYLVFWC